MLLWQVGGSFENLAEKFGPQVKKLTQSTKMMEVEIVLVKKVQWSAPSGNVDCVFQDFSSFYYRNFFIARSKKSLTKKIFHQEDTFVKL